MTFSPRRPGMSEEQVLREREADLLPEEGHRLIDLFAGAGGMSLGFTSFGHTFRSVWANEWDIAAADTYRENFGPHCTTEDIQALVNSDFAFPDADIVIGGPPCQGFSLLNKKREGDERRQLWRPFLDVVGRVGAQVFVMENVQQLLCSPEYHEIVEVASEVYGFTVAPMKLVAADYGVPQTRTRAFIVGAKNINSDQLLPPKKTHFNPARVDSLDFTEYVSNPEPRAQSGGLRVAGGNVARLTGRWGHTQ